MRKVKVVLVARVYADNVGEAKEIAANIAEVAGRMLPTEEETVEVTEVMDEGEVEIPEEESDDE